MSQNDPYPEARSGQYIPPPPPPPPPSPQYRVASDIPPDSPYHRSPAPAGNGRGSLGWLGSAAVAVFAFLKYGLVILFKIPAFATLASAALSFGVYSLAYGPWAALSLVVMIFVHEMGHVLEIRRQGMQATAPIFIPLFGAAIFQRSHPTTAVKQAQIGIAGPIAGTVGATVAFVLFNATQNPVFLIAATIGFFLNLINMIPVWQLDGAWILAPVSPWFQVAGLGLIVVAALFFHIVSFLLILVAVLGIQTMLNGFRNANNPYYTSVPAAARLALGAAWLGLVLYLGVMSLQSEGLLVSLAR